MYGEGFGNGLNRIPKWIVQPNPIIAGGQYGLTFRAAGSKEGFFVFFELGEGTTEGASFRFYRDQWRKQNCFLFWLCETAGGCGSDSPVVSGTRY